MTPNASDIRPIRSLLVANRGEIALRILRTCRRLGIEGIAVFSQADRESPHVRAADRAICIGPAPAANSYLDAERIVEAALRCGADAVHPGYGFLAENAAFARRCTDAGLVFVGPRAEVIELMGSKAEARRLMVEHGVPVVPGYDGEDQDEDALLAEAERIGFPILIKASSGGGGKGMRIVQDSAGLPAGLAAARREAVAAFGDDRLVLERYFESVRHVEFQLFGDRQGNLIHLHERECTIQRRHQKILEESPSPALDEDLRAAMADAAIVAGRALNYDNAGTVEFLLTEAGTFHFLEINTRLQVEHPVTEARTGLDLVTLQIAVAEGRPLPLIQADVQAEGYALECRLYAEDPAADFRPQAGRILRWIAPESDSVRIDSGVESGTDVGIHYDPLLAKLIAWGPDRGSVFRRMSRALNRLVLLGPCTNRNLLQRIVADPEAIAGTYDTHFLLRRTDLLEAHDLENHVADKRETGSASRLETAFKVALCAALCATRNTDLACQPAVLPGLPPAWSNNLRAPRRCTWMLDGSDGSEQCFQLSYRFHTSSRLELGITGPAGMNDTEMDVLLPESSFAAKGSAASVLEVDGMRHRVWLETDARGAVHVQVDEHGPWVLRPEPRFPEPERSTLAGGYLAPMPAEIIDVFVKPGDQVAKGERLLLLHSMKMEQTLVAHSDGRVESVAAVAGAHVDAGAVLLVIGTKGEKETETKPEIAAE